MSLKQNCFFFVKILRQVHPYWQNVISWQYWYDDFELVLKTVLLVFLCSAVFQTVLDDNKNGKVTRYTYKYNISSYLAYFIDVRKLFFFSMLDICMKHYTFSFILGTYLMWNWWAQQINVYIMTLLLDFHGYENNSYVWIQWIILHWLMLHKNEPISY